MIPQEQRARQGVDEARVSGDVEDALHGVQGAQGTDTGESLWHTGERGRGADLADERPEKDRAGELLPDTLAHHASDCDGRRAVSWHFNREVRRLVGC